MQFEPVLTSPIRGRTTRYLLHDKGGFQIAKAPALLLTPSALGAIKISRFLLYHHIFMSPYTSAVSL